MEDQQEVAPQEATAEDVSAEQAQEVSKEITEDAEDETENPVSDQGQEDEPERKSRHQRRKEQIQRARQEAEEQRSRADQLQRQLEEFQRSAQLAQPPKESDFASYEEYQAALSGFHAMKQLDAREQARIEKEYQAQQQAAQHAEQMRQREVQESWASQVAEAKSRYRDFDAVVGDPSVPIPQHVADIVLQMDGGPDVAYHLGSNRQEAARIASLPPALAAVELGALQATLSRSQPQPVTQAPDPISPVKPKARVTRDPAKMTAGEYRKWRESGGTL